MLIVQWLLLSLPLGIMIVHRAVVWVASRKDEGMLREGATEGEAAISWFRPLKGGVGDLEAKLHRFLRDIGPRDEVIFGVNPESEEEALCLRMAAADPRVRVVSVGPGRVPNPKIAKLVEMAALASCEYWVVLDAEAETTAEFVAGFRGELVAANGGVVTVGYRFVKMRSALEWLDVLPSIQTLWPGLRVVKAFGKFGWTLGACTGFPAAAISEVGGWEVLGDRLAEDHYLGALLSRAGKKICLSSQVIDLQADSLSWTEYWRHQRRLAITYRVAAPLGAAGMILPQGFPLCLALFLAYPHGVTAVNLALSAVAQVAGVVQQASRLGYPIGPWILWSLPASLVETLCWALSWFSRKVWWGGKWRRITPRGLLHDTGDADHG